MLKPVNFPVHNKLSMREATTLGIRAFLDFMAQFQTCKFLAILCQIGLYTDTHIFFPYLV